MAQRRSPRNVQPTNPAGSLAARLVGFDGTYAASWKPEPGDMIVGKVERYGMGPETAYGRSPVVQIKDEATGKSVSVWLSSTVLRNEFVKHDPQPGEVVGIKYFGVRENEGGKYHHFAVMMDRPQEGLKALLHREGLGPRPAKRAEPEDEPTDGRELPDDQEGDLPF